MAEKKLKPCAKVDIAKIDECSLPATDGMGMGNVQPPPFAAMTAVEQSANAIGSGDKLGSPKKKKQRITRVLQKNEAANVNPHDKLGNMMLDKLKIPSLFKKTKDGSVTQSIKTHNIKKYK